MSTTITGYASKGKGQSLEKWSYEAAPLGANDIHIDIAVCGICHSDIHTLDSGWGPTQYPVIVGHEIVGTVKQVGSQVTKFKVGDRVGVGAQVSSCHSCRPCRSSSENICPSRVFTYNASYPDGKVAYGGYADAVRVPAEFAIKIPDALPTAEAAPLLCAGVTVFAPLKRHMKPGCKVGVVGIGGLGHLALQFAKALGASEVIAISTSDRKKQDALSLGATGYINTSDVSQLNKAAGTLDVIICTASSDELIWELYISLVAVRGTFVVVGLPEKPISLNLAVIILNEVSIVGSAIGSPTDIEDMLNIASRFKVLPWIEKVPMSEVNEAIARVRKNDVRFRFVLENSKSN